MTRVAVVFHSATGSTRALALAVSEGAAAIPGVEVHLAEVLGVDIVEGRFKNPAFLAHLSAFDGMIFGSPTFMGSVSAQFKAFADATGDLWADQAWRNKLAAGFTIGSNLNGDQLNSLQTLQIFANQHGMIWAGLDIPGNCDPEGRNRLGAQSGLVAHSKDGAIDPRDLVTARYLGQRVALLTKKLTHSK